MTRWTFTFFLLFSFAASAPAQDAARDGAGHSLRGLGYWFIGGGSQSMAVNSGVGGEILFKGLGAQGEIGGIGLGAADNNKTTGLGSLDLVYHYFPRKQKGSVAPFVAAGYSEFFGHNTHTEYGGGGAYHTFGNNFGGGVDLLATKRIGLRFDVRYYGHGGRILNWVYPNVQQFSFVAVRVGVTFR